MKRVIIFLILTVTVCSICYSQKKFIYNEYGEKIYFHEIDSIVIVKYGKSVTENDKLRIARAVNPNHNIKSSQTNREIILIDKKVKSDIEELKEDKSAVYINKSLISDDDGTLQVPTDKVLVKMKPQYMLDKILKMLHIEYEQYKRLGHDDHSYLITLNNGKSIEIANKLYESGYFVYAQPSFTHFQGLLNQYYNNQWGLNNTGQYGGTSGIDIKAVQAWNITKGSNSIKVAVVDQGVDLSHPDLAANLLPGYDATDGALGGVNGACLSYDAHGTACAGIIAAIDNTIGIKGVAPNCKIIPVRVSYSSSSQPHEQIWDDDWKVDAINYAWYNASADIISCSWKSTIVAALTNEINAAITQGRNGKGCVVVFAAGNDNASSVSYPASLSNVIAVGAISQCGTRKRSSSNLYEVNQGVNTDPLGVSCDGEGWWGSNYGANLDVVAPGVDIYTTDIQGSAGYNTANGTAGDYYIFGGTSAACPHVAGIAALILSIRPDLTQAQVRQAIESTCTKLSGYSYSTNSNHPNGTWNNQVGHGLVNAYAAVYSVIQTISGADFLCPGNSSTYTITNKPSNATVTWSSGSNISLTGTNNTTSSNATFLYGSHVNSSYLYGADGKPTGYYNTWIQATLNIGGYSWTLPVKYIKEPDITKGVYSQYGVYDNSGAAIENRMCSYSNPYVSSPDGPWITVKLFSDPNVTYSWSLVNVTSNSYPNLYPNGIIAEFQHTSGNTYNLTVSATYCGASHSFTREFYPYQNGSGGVDCMSAYYSGDETLEVSFENTVSKQINTAVIASKTTISYSIQLYSITGSLIKEGRSSGETVRWNLSAFPHGVYVLRVKDSNNKVYNKIFLKN